MDFLFYVPFFCTAAGVVADICFVNIKFFEHKKLISNQVKRASHFVKIIVATLWPSAQTAQIKLT
jgi:hypothetical protein